MPEQDAANVLTQDRPEEVEEVETAEESTDAKAEEAGEETDQKADAKEGDAEHKKRLGGWQRKILKLEQERDVWRDQALGTRGTQKAEEKSEAVDEDKPVRPKLSTFDGTVEQFEKAIEEHEAKLEKWMETKRQRETVEREVETSVASLTEQVTKLEEWDDMRAAVKTHKMPVRLTNLLISEVSKLKNGAETLKALLLDPDEASQLAELDKYEDAISIKAQIMSMSRALRIAGKKSEAVEEEVEETPPKKAPAPITPTKKTAPTSTGLDDSLSDEEWLRRRNAQLRKK